jgi:tetratricopeptide (TPR) repeat protein
MFSSPAPGLRAAPPPTPAVFADALDAWQLDRARALLPGVSGDPQRQLALGTLLVYEANYEQARKVLASLLASEQLSDPRELSQARHYLGLASGAISALEGAITRTREGSPFVAVFASEKDTLLADYFFDAMANAHAELGDVFGIRPPSPIRFEFLDESAKLALVTPLGFEAIATTGTIGITKYRRVMMVTPRVMMQGYAWLDAATHEYVHYLVTLRTQNRAPVWMQEGLAKYFEQRWRRPGPPEMRESVEALLHRAIERDELVTLEEMSPSIALLPSREQAALAYAEVETMIGLLARERGSEGMNLLLDSVANGADPKEAFAAAWGADFDTFMEDWKADTFRRTARARSGEVGGPQFLAEGESQNPEVDPSLFGDVFSHLGGGKARQHARLGVLLTLRGHTAAAIIEYERARKADPSVAKDSQLARRLGELLLQEGRSGEAAPLLDIAGAAEPDNPNVAAAQGRALLQIGSKEAARAALQRALRVNPFIPQLHCDLAELETDPERAAREREACPNSR